MKKAVLLVAGAVTAVMVLLVFAVVYLRVTGLSARTTPGAVEAGVARAARRFATPTDVAGKANPIARTPGVLADGMAHFADHCASCHANDGSGSTDMGRAFYPKAPDMRLPATQELSDGELFYIIENGIRFTGMPAWSTGTPEGEQSSWALVHFIRHLPKLTAEEIAMMEERNPRSPVEIRQEIEEERFLRGEP